MIRFLADENFNHKILRGLFRRNPALDLKTVQDVGLRGADDSTVLAWAAREGRIVLSHDEETMIGFAYERIRAGEPMPGLMIVDELAPIGPAIEAILLVVGASEAEEWGGRVEHLPV